MRRSLAFLLFALFALTVLACGGTSEPPAETEAPASQAAEPTESTESADPPLFSSDFEEGDTSEWSESQEETTAEDDSNQ